MKQVGINVEWIIPKQQMTRDRVYQVVNLIIEKFLHAVRK